MDLQVEPTARDNALDGGSRRLVVNLIKSKAADIDVRSCEVLIGNCRHRTSFSDFLKLEKVFAPHFARQLRELVGKIPQQNGVLSIPTFCLESKETAFWGVQVVSNATEDDATHIIVRFKIFMGSLDGIFNPPIQISNGIENETQQLASDILADIALPLLNHVYSPDDHYTPLSDEGFRGSNIRTEQITELVFRIELLKRFVSQKRDLHPMVEPLQEIPLDTFDALPGQKVVEH